MRLYSNLLEMYKEVERDLFEMGVGISSNTMQDKDVQGDTDYDMKELVGYSYRVTDVNNDKIESFIKELNLNRTYLVVELAERVGGVAKNPGDAYKFREKVWQPFLHLGKFSYTYSQRMGPYIYRALAELKRHRQSRQIIIPIYWPNRDTDNWGGRSRVPCSMYYQVLLREGRIDLIYNMRSCDLYEHFPYDVSLACFLIGWFSRKLNIQEGHLIHQIGSLHIYRKDWKNRRIF